MVLGLERKSLRREMIAINMITLGVTLLLVSGALVIHEYEVSRSAILGQITEQARLIGRVSAPALRANDRTLLEQLIAGLKSQQDVTRAAIFTGNGDLFTIILEHFETVAATSSKCSSPLRRAGEGAWSDKLDINRVRALRVRAVQRVGCRQLSGAEFLRRCMPIGTTSFTKKAGDVKPELALNPQHSLLAPTLVGSCSESVAGMPIRILPRGL